MSELSQQHPFVHVYPQQKARQSTIIKGNTEGLCALINALISAIAHPDRNGVAELFCGDAEPYEVIINLVKTHDELSPLPYQNLQS
ncbi:hypothetical protein ACE1AT_14365 [Pelatocladus sp. BLCC-F211]|uniref:Uncharacterized protein n=1 Tax=Fischerella thermalis CCMEE 5318 TaxID=2019666 RepID=A0A2N6LP60_9CYAN|nr:hypothetical protein [Fischerella thermalis]PMB27528.1 hypothetical protein CEN46_01295 [Fischerella thermalis CCMEE 5318]